LFVVSAPQSFPGQSVLDFKSTENVRFENYTAMLVKITALWNFTPCMDAAGYSETYQTTEQRV